MESLGTVFQPLGSDYNDEIGAHMGIFSRIENPGHYWELVDSTVREIRRCIGISKNGK